MIIRCLQSAHLFTGDVILRRHNFTGQHVRQRHDVIFYYTYCWLVEGQLLHLPDVLSSKVKEEKSRIMLMRWCDVMTSCHLATSQPLMLTKCILSARSLTTTNGGSKGGVPALAPYGPKFLEFHAVFGKFLAKS